MRKLVLFLLLCCCLPVVAQAPRIAPQSTVYIEPMGGYETYLAAAFAKKGVPLIVVTDKSKADYLISSTVNEKETTHPAIVINNTNSNDGNDNSSGDPIARAPWARSQFGSTSASISVIDLHSSAVVFAYSIGKSRNTNQIQSTAEACAKHLKEFIEKPKK